MWIARRRVFQAEGTANAKALRLENILTSCGYLRSSSLLSITNGEIIREGEVCL